MQIIKISQLIIAILLIVSILMQNRGGGLSNVFGGGGNVYMTKRGLEKKLFIATIVLSVLFFSVSLLAIIL
ncbi:MAG: Preprotein translocase, SecG subunit [Candidatus Falkowbacteria bacterium GW2011_GWC2_38_22]|uniref:Protein-export membrane protein SecG n=1 Tax=Candidatus Falkowbacteria bacterium GW2011_GWE1_38_31 TaxID=1618638 RepID=A0A0G0JRQ0_9BACT|nr:MAG: Preprotein translocase, SecG subunit [Candidatus Falkowbacteria bacterium GW2011_GWF2_38_1205]KKQ61017.1 MAG: Preprotein translocase, SecG subunit [Candidatus Falkowbacteria bacterium GW2011_GWC2_38_22]KKQ63454.1 MAG: Preprotein translocase, SecG subunit [Candidatus Falkowbacteria bacterium GW2011_GWF1_38_22]KKQ65475.1 MAG: Preprotein translocase, SecG subunit [Candidatus Falkowbacteria bacterium GW2011_GWE2_38_254]KKQ70218.1 MAG: Preprotein translocase, SecG subunit [Candidatus Falkowb